MRSVSVGVDIATAADRTAAAVIRWSDDAAAVAEIVHPCSDDDIARLAALGTVGIDCALGWPSPFVRFLDDLRAGTDVAVPEADGARWRESLSMRATDLHVHRVTGRRPLSVATDRLGLVAMRTASILARLRAAGSDVARDGSGDVVEVYPAAALRCWGVDARAYKTDAGVRERIVAELEQRMPWLDWAGTRDRVVASDHVLDAVIASLVTRAAQLGRVGRPAPAEVRLAREEGWIALPECGPELLLA